MCFFIQQLHLRIRSKWRISAHFSEEFQWLHSRKISNQHIKTHSLIWTKRWMIIKLPTHWYSKDIFSLVLPNRQQAKLMQFTFGPMWIRCGSAKFTIYSCSSSQFFRGRIRMKAVETSNLGLCKGQISKQTIVEKYLQRSTTCKIYLVFLVEILASWFCFDSLVKVVSWLCFNSCLCTGQAESLPSEGNCKILPF